MSPNDRASLLGDFQRFYDRPVSPTYKKQLLTLLGRHLPETGLSELSANDLSRFFRRHGRQWSISYLRKVHCAAAAFFEWAKRSRRLPTNPMVGVQRAIDYMPGREIPATPPLFLAYADHLRSIDRTADTVIQRVGDIRRFSGEDDPLAATPQMLGDYLRDHQLTWSQEYRRKIRASFVSFYGWAAREGHIDQDPTLNLQSIRPGKPPRSPINETELLEGFYSADLEVQTIIALAASMGLRRMEITVLHTKDRRGRLLTIHGKGNRERVVPLNDLCYELLVELERVQGAGFYFRNMRTGDHVHPSTVYKHAKRHIGSWCLHSLRHRAATVALRGGANLRQIQELLGHLSLSTTQIYAQVTIEELDLLTSSISWPRDPLTREDLSVSGNRISVDLDNLKPCEVAILAQAVSRHLAVNAA